MRIVKVEIDNFKGIKHLKADTNADIVVVEGAKGSGKTGFFEAIYYCFSGMNTRFCYDIFEEQNARVLVWVSNGNKEYGLEIMSNNENKESQRIFNIYENGHKRTLALHEYLEFIKNNIVYGLYFNENFISCDSFWGIRKYKYKFFYNKTKEINDMVKKYGFPIPNRSLVFDDYGYYLVDNNGNCVSGGFYSAGDNVLRKLVGQLMIIKHLEQKGGENPIFIDDVFYVIDSFYCLNMCEYFEKFNNQFFLTNFKDNELFFNKQKKVIKVDIDKLNIF